MTRLLSEAKFILVLIVVWPLLIGIAIWMALAEPAHPDEHFFPGYKP